MNSTVPAPTIAHGLRGSARGSRHLGAPFGRDRNRGGLLHHFLMAPLQRAFALVERDNIAVTIPKHLHFDVARAGEILFNQNLIVTERGLRLAFGARRAPRASSPGASTSRIPRPPPPAEALISTG